MKFDIGKCNTFNYLEVLFIKLIFAKENLIPSPFLNYYILIDKKFNTLKTKKIHDFISFVKKRMV